MARSGRRHQCRRFAVRSEVWRIPILPAALVAEQKANWLTSGRNGPRKAAAEPERSTTGNPDGRCRPATWYHPVMSPKADELLEQALSLSESERAELAGLLLRSLEPPPEADVEEAWREEVRSRLAAIDSGEAEMIPWSVVRDGLFARLSGRR